MGDKPHSYSDNSVYAKNPSGSVTAFAGHRIPIKIEIEEYNYLKSSGISGDQIRKGCSVKVFVGGVQILDDFARGYEQGYKKAERYIDDLELFWGWFPFNIESMIGKLLYYREQPCRIKSFIVRQGCMILETLDGLPFKKFVSDDEDDEQESDIKVKITSPSVWWNYSNK